MTLDFDPSIGSVSSGEMSVEMQNQQLPQQPEIGATKLDMQPTDENELAEVNFEDEAANGQALAGNSQNIKDYLLTQEKWLGNTDWGDAQEHETNGQLENDEIQNFMSKLQTGAQDSTARSLYDNWINQNSTWNTNFGNEHSYEDFEAFYNENNPEAMAQGGGELNGNPGNPSMDGEMPAGDMGTPPDRASGMPGGEFGENEILEQADV